MTRQKTKWKNRNIGEEGLGRLREAIQGGANTVQAIIRTTGLSPSAVYTGLSRIAEVKGQRKSNEGPGRPENLYGLKAGAQ